eukprot:1139784-Pelagomonas_calceolata.AAC.4
MKAEEALPTSIKEKETHWAKKSCESPPPQSRNEQGLWVSGRLMEAPDSRTQLRGVFLFSIAPALSGNKLVGIYNRMGMKFASTMGMKFASMFIGTLVAQSQMLKLVKGHPIGYTHAAAVPPSTLTPALRLHSI